MRVYNPTKYEVICGVYAIKNKINNKYYIGKSDNIYARWDEHKNELLKGIHNNNHLQRSWNKYSEENFEFFIIEKCLDSDSAYEREKYWIDYYDSFKNGYNQNSGGKGGFDYKHTEETRVKMSEIQSAKMQDEEYLRKLSLAHKTKPIVQVNLITKEVTHWRSSKDAARHLNLNHDSSIAKATESKTHLSHDSLWFNESDYVEFKGDPVNFLFDFTIYYVRYVNIYQYNFKGELVKIWDYKSLINDQNFDNSKIYKCCNYEMECYANYIWLFEKDILKIEEISSRFKKQADAFCEPINVYNSSEEFIGTYDNARHVINALNIRQTDDIIKCCYGIRKSVYGYIFKFAEKEYLYEEGRSESTDKINNKLSKIKRRVYQYDKDFNLIKIWDSMIDIYNELKYSRGGIIKCCQMKQEYSHGYIWRYEEDVILNKTA